MRKKGNHLSKKVVLVSYSIWNSNSQYGSTIAAINAAFYWRECRKEKWWEGKYVLKEPLREDQKFRLKNKLHLYALGLLFPISLLFIKVWAKIMMWRLFDRQKEQRYEKSTKNRTVLEFLVLWFSNRSESENRHKRTNIFKLKTRTSCWSNTVEYL